MQWKPAPQKDWKTGVCCHVRQSQQQQQLSLPVKKKGNVSFKYIFNIFHSIVPCIICYYLSYNYFSLLERAADNEAKALLLIKHVEWYLLYYSRDTAVGDQCKLDRAGANQHHQSRSSVPNQGAEWHRHACSAVSVTPWFACLFFRCVHEVLGKM